MSDDVCNQIKEVILRKKQIQFHRKNIKKDKVIIIDFYNIYCNMIEFSKYKQFSHETFVICLDKILNKLRNYIMSPHFLSTHLYCCYVCIVIYCCRKYISL